MLNLIEKLINKHSHDIMFSSMMMMLFGPMYYILYKEWNISYKMKELEFIKEQEKLIISSKKKEEEIFHIYINKNNNIKGVRI
jgi:hypothetical protein